MQHKPRMSRLASYSFLAMWKHWCYPIPPQALFGLACLHSDRKSCPSSGPGAGAWLIGFGWAFHSLLDNFSEGGSHKGDQLSSYCIIERSQHKIKSSCFPALPSSGPFFLFLHFLASTLSHAFFHSSTTPPELGAPMSLCLI